MPIQTNDSKSGSRFRFACFTCVSYLLVGFGILANQGSIRAQQLGLQKSQLSQSNQMDCLDRMKEFVSELDALLDKNPPTLDPFLNLLNRTFPLTGCDIEEVVQIAKKSKYFSSPSHNGSVLVFSFSSASRNSGPFSGFDVSFGISKLTGNTELPFAKIHKGG
jgi:hypothetical protein